MKVRIWIRSSRTATGWKGYHERVVGSTPQWNKGGSKQNGLNFNHGKSKQHQCFRRPFLVLIWTLESTTCTFEINPLFGSFLWCRMSHSILPHNCFSDLCGQWWQPAWVPYSGVASLHFPGLNKQKVRTKRLAPTIPMQTLTLNPYGSWSVHVYRLQNSAACYTIHGDGQHQIVGPSGLLFQYFGHCLISWNKNNWYFVHVLFKKGWHCVVRACPMPL